jgi:ribosomal protein L19E
MKAELVLLNNYLGIINQLPEDDKLELIIRLSKMLQGRKKKVGKSRKTSIGSLYGALNDAESAETWIARIRSSRTFNRKIEAL